MNFTKNEGIKKPIKMIGSFSKRELYYCSYNLYSSTFRYNVAILISNNRAASALFPFV